ncbi:cell division protein ZapA [Vibrio sp. SCSIO 43136]|uniref:cell division protein ZapA n=1 Tax=Vibrio sp. SCSIO 43136 TaxID=2819101 RepID=UPI002075B475|nr:cell division protein ZapA [Vibrio sp. SCSIO 43136]USD65640.1 cell division protein ZapA [Vibrio sp. SCSIO 43136]
MSNQAVEVEILGKVTRVNCPAGEEDALIQAALDLDARLKSMSEKTQVSNVEKLLTFAALNVCYELHTSKQQVDGQNHQITERMEKLDQALESALMNVGQNQK